MPQVSVRSPNGTFEPAATIFTAGVPLFRDTILHFQVSQESVLQEIC